MVDRRRGARALGTAVLLTLAACGGQEASPLEPPALEASAVCPGGAAADGVVVCSRLNASGDALVLPADTADRPYGAFARGGDRFMTRGGALPVDQALLGRLAEQGTRGQDDGSGAGAGDLAARSGPYAQQVYRATVEDGTVVDLEPAVRVDESALLTRVFGGRAMEGRMGRYLGEEEGFALDLTLPVRLELDEAADDAVLRGRIVNATAGVRTSTGRCAPALRAAGAGDPLQQEPFSAAVALQRVPSMHGPFNDELLLVWSPDASNMGPAFFPSMATLLGLDDLEETWETYIHGSPTAGPPLELTLVEGGGGAC